MPDQISVRIVADSQNPLGVRITSFILTFPKFLLAEFNTHRAISRNAASSRAIPTHKQIEKVRRDPVTPVRCTSAKAGMQGGEPIEDEAGCRELIMASAQLSANLVEILQERKLHKQHAARYLEPFLSVTVLATATEWKNFFSLRASVMAQPELQVLAWRMLSRYLEHKPQRLGWGEWHMPFGDKMEAGWSDEEKLKVATARCARLSYQTFDGNYSYEEDRRLHDQLVASKHLSPTEHCAQAVKLTPGNHSNFHPTWMQYRKHFQNEHGRDEVDLDLILQEKPDWITL